MTDETFRKYTLEEVLKKQFRDNKKLELETVIECNNIKDILKSISKNLIEIKYLLKE